MAADLGKSIRMSVDSGKVKFGTRDAVKAALNGSAKAVVISENCPKDIKADITRYAALSEVPVLAFSGTSIELGSVCGKPFAVSALAVNDVGNSGLLDFVKEKKE